MPRLLGTRRTLLRPGGNPRAYYDPDLVAFTPGMDKRTSPGPFATAPICQGHWDGTGVPDSVEFPRGGLIGNATELRYANLDPYQGTIVFWITPEWDGNDGKDHWVLYAGDIAIRKHATSLLYGYFGFWSQLVTVDVSGWTAGTTYCIVFRWDARSTLDGTNYAALSINNAHTYGGAVGTDTDLVVDPVILGEDGISRYAADSIIEGFTIYRRVLVDSNGYGTRPMNGNQYSDDELGAIYL